MQKLKILFILFIVCAPCFMYAQSKPKRDKSKDRSVVVAKQQTQAKKKAAKEVTGKERIRTVEVQQKRNVQVTQTPKSASYLTVNQLTSISKTLGSNSGNERFNVNTDGKEWAVLYLPLWCKITKYDNYFILSYDVNTSHDDRVNWFEVKCDNQKVRVNITQNGTPLNIKSHFNYADLAHNVEGFMGSHKCLKVNAKVTIQGAKGQKCLVVAFINDEYNNSIKATSRFSHFGTQSSNDLYVSTEIIPTTDSSESYYVTLYLPNDAMRLWKKKNKLNCNLAVYCPKTASYISGANYTLNFTAKNKKGKVTTKNK